MVRWRTREWRLLRARAAVMAAGAAGMLAISLAGAGGASAAIRSPSSGAPQTSTKDYTCHPRAESIYTCQWLRQTLEKQPCPVCVRAFDYKAWFSMKGGTAGREIIDTRLQGRDIGGSPQPVRNASPRKSGHGTISVNLAKALCTYPQYRPSFYFRYFHNGKWIYDWSYGAWYNTPYGKYCHGIGIR